MVHSDITNVALKQPPLRAHRLGHECAALYAVRQGFLQGAQRALAAARRYQEVVLAAIAGLDAGPLAEPAAPGPPLLLVLTAEQPFCGAFNQNVLALAERRWRELRQGGPAELVVVGQRGARLLQVRGIVPDASEPSATSPPGLRDLVKRLDALLDLERRERQGQITRQVLELVGARFAMG